MRYKPGDRVVIKSDLTLFDFYLDTRSRRVMRVVPPMDRLAGCTVTIGRAIERYDMGTFYTVKECSEELLWSDGMFCPPEDDSELSQSGTSIEEFILR